MYAHTSTQNLRASIRVMSMDKRPRDSAGAGAALGDRPLKKRRTESSFSGQTPAVKTWAQRAFKCMTYFLLPDIARICAEYLQCPPMFSSGADDNTVCVWDATSFEKMAVLRGHTSWVRTVVFSPDGNIVASGGDDYTIRLWDTTDWKEIAVLRSHVERVEKIVFSPDGKFLASGGFDGVRVWDAYTFALTAMLEMQYGFTSLAFSPNGHTLLSGDVRNIVRVLNATTLDQITQFSTHKQCIRTIACSPDGKTIATGGCDINIWDAHTFEKLNCLDTHNYNIFSIAFSPDGSMMASAGADRVISLWSTATWMKITALKVHTDWVQSLAFSPDGLTIVSGGSDHTVQVCSTATFKQLAVLKGHTEWVRSVAFSPG
jgi:WD40 repeat protein